MSTCPVPEPAKMPGATKHAPTKPSTSHASPKGGTTGGGFPTMGKAK